MAASEQIGGSSLTPTQRLGFKHHSRKSDDLSGITRPSLKEHRSLSGSSHNVKSLLITAPSSGTPGSFSTELKSAGHTRTTTPFSDNLPRSSKEEDVEVTSQYRQALITEAIAKEMKIKIGTENMLEALSSKNSKQIREQRLKVEQELGTSNRKLATLRLELESELQRLHTPTTPPSKRMSSYFRGSPLKTPSVAASPGSEFPANIEDESPTVVLTETLQALEVEGMQPDYYIDRANRLVDLFKRNPTLKYDLAWSVFSLRVQTMLLSESSDVVAAGYRLTRYAITDRASLRTIQSLHTDELVLLSLVKKGSSAMMEREQAVKFVRSFLDVKDGAREISKAVLRGIVAVAEHKEDRLNSICLLTLAEILTKNPALLVSANGLSTLTEALSEGTFPVPEAIVASLLHILDHPQQRQYLSSGREFEALFAPFTDPLTLNGDEEKLRTCAKAISAMLKTWPGFLTLAMNDAQALRSIIDSLVYPDLFTRDLIIELLFDVLRIKAPSWSSSFLAGRRLTQYNRMVGHVVEQKAGSAPVAGLENDSRFDLAQHFSTFVLVTLLRVGLVKALMQLIQGEQDMALRRKATLLLTEVLKQAHSSLPARISDNLQVLGDLLQPFSNHDTEASLVNLSMVYQIESINRTVNRAVNSQGRGLHADELAIGPQATGISKMLTLADESVRQAIADSLVVSHNSHLKWKWDTVNDIIAGPLTNPKRLDEIIKGTRFLRRLTGFYRPFKYRFSGLRNTRPNQRYVRTGCALLRSLVQTPVGIQFLIESKMLRQIAECLAQVDLQSGLTSNTPLFDRHQMEETLSGGYFAMLGALSESPEGIQILERWHMMNMFYHIVDRYDREDLVRALIGNMDYSLNTHLRIVLSKALTCARKAVRLFATKLLRKYAIGRASHPARVQSLGSAHWALRLVLTQLYDPDVEVCETAIKILEEACDNRSHLEYVVKCRPALDHLGELGAPLLLRFLSTSTGYRYLDGLDYITQEMDDWFLGRNDSYVTMVEASLARAYLEPASQKSTFQDDQVDIEDLGMLPPHFYRELARTEEGCRLLRKSGHFYEFAATIRDFNLDESDVEVLTKIKGCLWAVGNIGSMEFGSPFLRENDVVQAIVRIAEGADVMSVRGTACFSLGLISRSLHGVQLLSECGWDTATDSRGRSLGLCIPRDPTRLCLKSLGSGSDAQYPSQHDIERFKAAAHDPNPIYARILRSIVEMGNSVLYKKAAGELHLIKTKHPEPFATVALFRKTLLVLEMHHYRLQARQFILDLFDKKVLRRVVLEEDSASESESGSE